MQDSKLERYDFHEMASTTRRRLSNQYFLKSHELVLHSNLITSFKSFHNKKTFKMDFSAKNIYDFRSIFYLFKRNAKFVNENFL